MRFVFAFRCQPLLCAEQIGLDTAQDWLTSPVMNTALALFPPTRTAALETLHHFLPKAGKDYASRRNFDFGSGAHQSVSGLSPYLRTRLLVEPEVVEAVLGRFSLNSAEKFIQEVFWRTYWKGWLEMRPGVWHAYQTELARDWNQLQTQDGLQHDWEAACMGSTGIDCFDHWAQELVTTGYLHNHARMWFASIWIFTLRLPWTLGADFFLRHLLDGDPASNTLSWRWVGGLQTRGKTYLARPDNIAKYTEGRFNPTGLAREATPLPADPPPALRPIPNCAPLDANKRSGFVLHTDDLSPGFALDALEDPVPMVSLIATDDFSPLQPAPHIAAFQKAAQQDVIARFSDRMDYSAPVTTAQDIIAWAMTHDFEQIVTPYAPVGPIADVMAQIEQLSDIPLVQIMRPYDRAAWPHATHGFFRFKDKIPALLAAMKGLRVAQ